MLKGLLINIMSTKKATETGIGWHKGGENLKYNFSKVNRDA